MRSETLTQILEINSNRPAGETVEGSLGELFALMQVDYRAMREAHAAGEPVIRERFLRIAAAAIRVADHDLIPKHLPKPDPDGARKTFEK